VLLHGLADELAAPQQAVLGSVAVPPGAGCVELPDACLLGLMHDAVPFAVTPLCHTAPSPDALSLYIVRFVDVLATLPLPAGMMGCQVGCGHNFDGTDRIVLLVLQLMWLEYADAWRIGRKAK